MIRAGLNMRVGPMCRTVEDAARILDVIAGYDPKDEMTVFSIGRKPARPYASFAAAWGNGRLEGVRIGVLREYMSRKLFAKADEESIDIIERAIDDLRKLGATIVDPGPEKELFKDCLARYAPRLMNSAFTRQYPQLFGENQIATLVDPDADPKRPSEVPRRRRANRLVAHRATGLHGNHGPCRLDDGGMGPRGRRQRRHAADRAGAGESAGRCRFHSTAVRRAPPLPDRVGI